MAVPVLHYAAAGTGSVDVRVDLERLVASRLLCVSNSGGGKSRALRQLLEETHGHVQQIVLDPEGEFGTLREQFPYVLAGREGDVPAHPKSAKLLCRRLMELQASVVIDLFDLPLSERREFVRLFLTELMALPRTLWRPCLVVIDEAHLFCPERGAGESQSTDAVISLCTLGRKRGYAAILATQRISKLHKDAAAELLNKLVGRTGLDVDLKRAGDELGFDKEQRQALKTLKPGEFFCYGPAIAPTVTRVVTGPVRTSHPQIGTTAAQVAPAPTAVKALLAQLQDLPQQAEAEAKTIATLEAQLRDTRALLRKAERAAPASVVDEQAIERALAAERRQQATVQTRQQKERATVVRALARVSDQVRAASEALAPLIDGLRALDAPPAEASAPVRVVATAPAVRSTSPGPRPEVARPVSSAAGRVLGALLQLELLGLAPSARRQVAFFAGYTENGHFNNVLGSLNSSGRVSYSSPGFVALTDAGRAEAPDATQFDSLDALHTYWLGRIGTAPAKLLAVLLEAYPQPVSRADLAARTGYTQNGHFNNMLGRLRSMGAAEYPAPGDVVAAAVLFPEGLH